MNNYNTIKDISIVKSWVYYGILFICLLGTFMHFAYDLSGKSLIVGFIAPINESIWEHLKLAFLPTILWWTISYIIISKKNEISFNQWFFSMVVSLVICPLFIVAFYYTYTGAFGIHSMILDIASLFIGVTLGQLIALHIYQYANLKPYHIYIAATVFVALIVSFIVFTISPPNYPIFWD